LILNYLEAPAVTATDDAATETATACAAATAALNSFRNLISFHQLFQFFDLQFCVYFYPEQLFSAIRQVLSAPTA
jgi:hypothetical protein